MFSEIVLDHFTNPRNQGALAEATHTGTAGEPGDGPYMRLWFVVEQGQVTKAAYETWGCPAAVACGSLIAQIAPGRTPAQMSRIDANDVSLLLGGLPEGKAHCAELAVRAVNIAFERGD